MRRVSTILDDCENEALGSRILSVLGGRKQSELLERSRRLSVLGGRKQSELSEGSRRLSVLGGRKQSELSEGRDLSVGCKISDEGVMEHVSGKRRKTIFAS